MIKKQIIVPLVAVAILGTGAVYAVTAAHAQTSTGPLSGLVKEIATKFGLDESKVQSIVTNYQTQHKAQMEEKREQREANRLDSLVKDGKITDAQRQAILSEQAKLKSEYPLNSQHNLTPQQKRDQFQKMKDELTSWAQSQGIDIKYVLPLPGMMGPGGMHRGWMMKGMLTPTPTLGV